MNTRDAQRELKDLRLAIEHEVMVVTSRQVQRFFAERTRRRLPRLVWSLARGEGVVGQIGAAYADTEIAGIAEKWASALGLTRVEQPVTGMIEYAGTVDDVQVRIWGVVDHDAFYQGGQ